MQWQRSLVPLFLFDTAVALLTVAFCVGFLITLLGVWIAARRMRWVKPGKIAFGAGVVAMLILALLFSLTILQPLPSTLVARQPTPVPAGVNYWNLSTGSHIAYLEMPAQGIANATPIIFVGGGPGEEDVADRSQTQFFGQLALLGYNVYFYDQIGSGLSARLEDPEQYTLARHVADLEAIREQIGAKKVILLGESWGGTLVANYTSNYPQHVAKMIFTSPAPINASDQPDFGGSVTSMLNKTAQQQANQMLFGNPRFLAWYLLGEINPKAAKSFVSDQEADAFFNTFLQIVRPGTVCDPAHLPKQVQQGNGFYDNIFTTRNAGTAHPKISPRAILILASDNTPSLIMTGSCNYISWAATWQYKTTLPGSTLLYFQDAGHVIYLDQPSLYLASIQAFLLGKPLPLQPWTSPQPPDSFKGPVG